MSPKWQIRHTHGALLAVGSGLHIGVTFLDQHGESESESEVYVAERGGLISEGVILLDDEKNQRPSYRVEKLRK